uniref:Uncharacterized protein n=1 Tax=Musa acuminata subsp. malaccensis TaxID=214687 RepID=A0A804HS47_MUSAM
MSPWWAIWSKCLGLQGKRCIWTPSCRIKCL